MFTSLLLSTDALWNAEACTTSVGFYPAGTKPSANAVSVPKNVSQRNGGLFVLTVEVKVKGNSKVTKFGSVMSTLYREVKEIRKVT